MYIHQYINWHNSLITVNGIRPFDLEATAIEELPAAAYRASGISYPKFFKMDILSRVAFLATELLNIADENIDKNKIATVISTAAGCIDVDKKFQESRGQIASPALFVYTLPNIMLGEICIRHGFKGAQMCLIDETFDAAMLHFHVADLLSRGDADTCLCGHVDATADHINAQLMWVNKEQGALIFNEENVAKIAQL